MVRLAPYLVEALCELTRALRDKTHAQTEVSGLLFGTSDDGLVTVEALKTFKDSGPRSDLARRERMEKSFTSAMAQAQGDPEFSAYKLLGWFSLRGSGGLINSDIEFHNQHFKNSDEVSLIVWREGDTQVTAELYARVEGKFTTEDYRWSSVRLSTELRRISEPVDLVMRMRLNEDSYLRTYASVDKEEKKEEWRKLATAAKRSMLSILPGRGKPDEYTSGSDTRTEPSNSNFGKRAFESRTVIPTPNPQPAAPPPPVAAPKPSAPAAAAAATIPLATAAAKAIATYQAGRTTRVQNPPEISGLPMVINRHKPKPKGVPWLSMALVFMLFSGVTFGVLALRGLGSGSGKLGQVMRVLFPGTDLELRAEGHGDRLLLTWNRKNPTVASASSAVLAITDGTQHFEKKLDPTQIADGSVLYRPVSGDVTFRLQIMGTDQSIAAASLRVLDATSPAGSTVGDASNPGAAPPSDLSPGITKPDALDQSRAANRTPQPVPTVPASNRSVMPNLTPPAPQSQPQASAISEAPKPVTQQPQTQPAAAVPTPQTQPPPAQTAAAQTSPQTTPPPAAPKPVTPAPQPQTQQQAARPNPNTPQTSNTEIKGWDQNLPDSKPAPQNGQQAPPPDAKTVSAFVGPKPLLTVLPDTRNLAPIAALTRVEVEVTIDPAGKVRSARVLNQPTKNQLASAAMAAAKQWAFQPATLRGQAVESNHTIAFDFKPQTQ